MSAPREAPYGTWSSPLDAARVAAGGVGLGAPCLDGETVYWLETRPAEGGRAVLVRKPPHHSAHDVTPAGFSVRSRVNEYGGGAYTVAAGVVYFVNDADQRIYRQAPDAAPEAITPEAGASRYADLVVDPTRARLLCVREAHRAQGEPELALVGLPLDGRREAEVLAAGHDFYASPRLSPDARHLAWLTWDHPRMPWDGTELWRAEIRGDGALAAPEQVAGGPDESVFQPEWSPEGELHFVSDRSDWWNLYRAHHGHVEALDPMEGELGLPQWVFGMSTYGFTGDGRLYCTYTRDGEWRLAELEPAGPLRHVPVPYTHVSGLRAAGGGVVFVGGSAHRPAEIVHLRVADDRHTAVAAETVLDFPPALLSHPRSISFDTSDGDTAYGLYYPPTNPAYEAPAEERPPLLVRSHGGPTAAASTALNLGIQFWTSRGFAVLDVNYRGSTGYGRVYRQALEGRWGEADVDDCVHGALHLVDAGLADRARLVIRGSSAGGYTTLAALTFRDVFSAGASLYGIGDLESLLAETHKFESRYFDSLLGPYPEARDVYRARSPVHHVDRLSAPVIFMQGLLDKVVPPSQAEAMVAALRRKRLAVAYVTFPDERHGFRRGENVRRALEAELYFYGRVLGFTPADDLEPVAIDNL